MSQCQTSIDQNQTAASILLTPAKFSSVVVIKSKKFSSKLKKNEVNNENDYIEKRKKNNQASKKSRDAYNMRVKKVVEHVNFLENDNLMLKSKVLEWQQEVSQLRMLLLEVNI